MRRSLRSVAPVLALTLLAACDSMTAPVRPGTGADTTTVAAPTGDYALQTRNNAAPPYVLDQTDTTVVLFVSGTLSFTADSVTRENHYLRITDGRDTTRINTRMHAVWSQSHSTLYFLNNGVVRDSASWDGTTVTLHMTADCGSPGTFAFTYRRSQPTASLSPRTAPSLTRSADWRGP